MIIGFDTATADTAVAALREGAEVFAASEGPDEGERPLHATVLLPLVEQAAEACGGWGRVERIVVGVGPGTFTGMRIGVVTAKALAAAHGCELVPVETTRALGSRAARESGRGACAVIDGRRGEVFAGLVEPAAGRGWGPVVLAPVELDERLRADGFEGPVVGDGVVVCRAELGHDLPGEHLDPAFDRIDAAELCRIGAAEPAVDHHLVVPLYLRRPDAERWMDRSA